MKKSIVVFTACMSVLLMSSCGGEKANETPVYDYSYNADNSVVEWTAFKFSNKTGVKGTFNDINISGIDSSTDPKAIIESLGFNIPTSTVETNDPGRNAKIAEFFFATIKTDVLKGQMVKLQDNGEAVFKITMNDITKEVKGKYTLEDGTFSLNATINVVDWNGQDGIDALNAQCIANHTGTDGVLKLWSEVDLSFTTKLDKTEKK